LPSAGASFRGYSAVGRAVREEASAILSNGAG